MQFDEVVNDETESIVVEKEKVDEMEEADKDMANIIIFSFLIP